MRPFILALVVSWLVLVHVSSEAMAGGSPAPKAEFVEHIAYIDHVWAGEKEDDPGILRVWDCPPWNRVGKMPKVTYKIYDEWVWGGPMVEINGYPSTKLRIRLYFDPADKKVFFIRVIPPPE